ncbi:MAG: c-type cytochrome [Campylobacterales bacterium]|nr:c-type cytochrome [Campylobacterales bacterium]
MKPFTAMVALSIGAALSLTPLSADVLKGQKLYLKSCKKCHGNGTKGAAMKTQDEWETLFEGSASGLIEAHKGDSSEPFFKNKQFQEIAPHLRDFLYEYAADSGNVPSC